MTGRTGSGGRRGVVLALTLMLAAIAALAWLGYRTVAERERALAFAFSATAQIARDRVDAELQAQQERFEREVRALGDAAEAEAQARQIDTLSTSWPGGSIWYVTNGVVATRDLRSGSEAVLVASGLDTPSAARGAWKCTWCRPPAARPACSCPAPNGPLEAA